MISDFIDRAGDWPMFALKITGGSESRYVRIGGVLLYAMTFIPLVLLWVVIAGVLCIPAMIEDAWKP